MDFITADLHLGHASIIEKCRRPFTDVDHMNISLINNINDRVGRDDRLIIVGDVAGKKVLGNMRKWRDMIICKNVFIVPGNHDKMQVLKYYFRVLSKIYEYKIPDFHLVISHYAMRTWNQSHKGSCHVYGHSHGKLPPLVGADGKMAKCFDVGVDCWNYRPLSVPEIRVLMKKIANEGHI